MQMERGEKPLGVEACVGTHQAAAVEHINTRWVIGTVHDGDGDVKVLGRSVQLQGGGVLIVPLGVVSQTLWHRASRVSTLFCWPEQFDQEVEQMSKMEVRAGIGEDRRLSHRVAALAKALTQPQGDSDASYADFLEALGDVVMGGDLRPLPYAPKSIRKVRDFLHHTYTEKISLDQLADVAGLSRFHLHKAFRASVGVPPHTYLMQLRLERARSLLSRGRLVAEVAAEVGFYDQSHFTRSFRKHFGITPRDFAQQSSFAVQVLAAP